MKTQLLLIAMILLIGCKKEDIQPDNKPIVSKPVDTIYVGHAYGGGIIAYLFSPGELGYMAGSKHGLIITPDDLGIYVWGGLDTLISTGENSGWNTDMIIEGLGKWNYAAYVCSIVTLWGNTGQNGTSVWCLPTQNDMIHIVKNIKLTGYYWTSSEYDKDNAWAVCGNGLSLIYKKDYHFNVRAIKIF
jgi:hypothetical protein